MTEASQTNSQANPMESSDAPRPSKTYQSLTSTAQFFKRFIPRSDHPIWKSKRLWGVLMLTQLTLNYYAACSNQARISEILPDMTTLDHRPVATRRGTPLDCDPKRDGRALIVSLDGTSNQFGEYNTNVVEIYHRIVKSERQRTYYNSGIGTYIAPASPWDRAVQFFYHSSNLVFAWDLKKHVLTAYRWLSENYQPGDRIYFFGFSRGAFQVRVLAGMIEKVGLLLPGNEEQIEFAYDLYKDLNSESRKNSQDNTQFYNMAARFKETFSHPGVHIYFVGVWDTVSSVGLFRNKQFPLTDTSEHVCYFRHALALDERRVKFLPEYARGGSSYAESAGLDSAGLRPRPPRVKEVWFSGSHSDIGGGIKSNTELSNGAISAVWMGNEAITAGLDLKPSKVLWDWKSLREDMPTKSLGSVWWLAEFLPMNFLAYTGIRKTYCTWHCARPRVIVEGQKIHASVAFKDCRYTPKAVFSNATTPEWDSVICKGKNTTTEWAADIKQYVEMDLFDYSQVSQIVEQLKGDHRSSRIELLDRLAFIAKSSEQGARAVVNADQNLTNVVKLLSSESNANITTRSLGLLAYLAKPCSYIGTLPNVLNSSIRMITVNDPELEIAGANALSVFYPRVIELQGSGHATSHLQIPPDTVPIIISMIHDGGQRHSSGLGAAAALLDNEIFREGLLKHDIISIFLVALCAEDNEAKISAAKGLYNLARYDSTRELIPLKKVVQALHADMAPEFETTLFDFLSELASHNKMGPKIAHLILVNALSHARNIPKLSHFLEILFEDDDARRIAIEKRAINQAVRIIETSQFHPKTIPLLKCILSHAGFREVLRKNNYVPMIADTLSKNAFRKGKDLTIGRIMALDACSEYGDMLGDILASQVLPKVYHLLQEQDADNRVFELYLEIISNLYAKGNLTDHKHNEHIVPFIINSYTRLNINLTSIIDRHGFLREEITRRTLVSSLLDTMKQEIHRGRAISSAHETLFILLRHAHFRREALDNKLMRYLHHALDPNNWLLDPCYDTLTFYKRIKCKISNGMSILKGKGALRVNLITRVVQIYRLLSGKARSMHRKHIEIAANILEALHRYDDTRSTTSMEAITGLLSSSLKQENSDYVSEYRKTTAIHLLSKISETEEGRKQINDTYVKEVLPPRVRQLDQNFCNTLSEEGPTVPVKRRGLLWSIPMGFLALIWWCIKRVLRWGAVWLPVIIISQQVYKTEPGAEYFEKRFGKSKPSLMGLFQMLDIIYVFFGPELAFFTFGIFRRSTGFIITYLFMRNANGGGIVSSGAGKELEALLLLAKNLGIDDLPALQCYTFTATLTAEEPLVTESIARNVGETLCTWAGKHA